MVTLERLDEAGADMAPVIERGRVIGLLGRDYLLSVLRRQNRLTA